MSGQKAQISNFINFTKRGVYQMQFELRDPMVPFIFFVCDVWNMLKDAFKL